MEAVHIDYHEDHKGKDTVRVRYDPARLTPEQIVEVVRKQGFTGTVVPGD